MFPLVIVIIVGVSLVLSNFQKEVGLAKPGKGGRAAAAAAASAQDAATGTGAADFETFSRSLLVAISETDNMAILNVADNSLRIALSNLLDCLRAAREAWQADLGGYWDPVVDGSATYWLTLHPSLSPPQETQGLSPVQVREWATSAAHSWLLKVLDLAE